MRLSISLTCRYRPRSLNGNLVLNVMSTKNQKLSLSPLSFPEAVTDLLKAQTPTDRLYPEGDMKPASAPNVPGSTEAERFDSAVRAVLTVSKDSLLKAEAKWKKKRAKRKAGKKPS